MDDGNLKVLELAYRRCDIADVVSAGVCAMHRANDIGWGKYIISAPPPFSNNFETLIKLDSAPALVFKQIMPELENIFKNKGWKMLGRIDRVYDSSKAVDELGWEPKHTFKEAITAISKGKEWRSDLTLLVGKKGYHDVDTGVYTQR